MLTAVTVVLGLTVVVSAQRGNDAETLLGQGLHLEDEGDCKEAIRIYERVLQQKDAARNVAARASLHIAYCQERLGSRDARATYEALLERYPEQLDVAAQANARVAVLTAQRPGAGMTRRHVWTEDPGRPALLLAASPEGQYLAFAALTRDFKLILRDLVNHVERPFPMHPDEDGTPGGLAAFSRDGSRLVYSWRYPDGHFGLWRIGFDGSKESGPTLVRDFRWDGQPGGRYRLVSPTDWSPDGVYILAWIEREEGPGRFTRQIALIDTRDRSIRIITSEEGQSHGAARLSPDGMFLAYSTPGVKPGDDETNIVVASTAKGAARRVFADPAPGRLVGWSPDGKYVLFESDRTGATGLYAVPVANGAAEGTPVLLTPNFTSLPGSGINAAGQVFYQVAEGPRTIRGDIKVAAYDFTAERFIEGPVVGVKRFVGRNSGADWSPDGQYLVNLSARSETVLVVHSADTGEVIRELRSGLVLEPGSPWPRWTADSEAIAVPATGADTRQGIYRVDAQTGQASPLVLARQGETLNGPAFSPDAKTLVYNRILAPPPGPGRGSPQGVRVIMERDLGTGDEREIMRGNLSAVLFSPDGRHFTTVRNDPDACAVLLVPAAGGEPKELMRANAPCRLWVEFWAPDSRSVFVADTPEPLEEFWRVSVDGGNRHKVRLDQKMGLSVRVHPDGRRLAYSVEADQPRTELWVLENVLAPLTAKK
jgi:Tol biopolymer transport system component